VVQVIVGSFGNHERLKKMSWQLWLDDQLDDPHCPERHTPKGYEGAKCVSDAMDLVLKHGPPSFMDLDFDLGGVETAMTFIRWLAQHMNAPATLPPEWKVHSRNPYAKEEIGSYLNSWKVSVNA
jgi:hypothetical protein